jgi:hypothetical protein
MLTKMVAAAQKSIERDYYCKLVGSDDEPQALPEGVRGFVADEDIQLAMQYLVGDAYLNGFTGQWLETAAVRHLLSRCRRIPYEPEAGRDDLPSFDWVYAIRPGPLGEHLPEQLVTTGKAWAKRELV